MRRARRRITLFLMIFSLARFTLNGESVQTSFSAFAFISARLPEGVTNARIVPAAVNSNGRVTAYATAEGNPAAMRMFFSSFTGQWELTNRAGVWESGRVPAFKNESVYTASFITVYSNGLMLTNRNKAWYSVDNTPPVLVQSRPSNHAVIESNTWDLIADLYDGRAGPDTVRSISNSFLIHAGGDGLFDTGDEATNKGKWTNLSSGRLAFFPVKPGSEGAYRAFIRPWDKAGNRGALYQIDFFQTDMLLLSGVFHEFPQNTQLTPQVPLRVTLKGSAGMIARFEVTGSSNIRNIPMAEISAGTYQGEYRISREETVKEGVVRGYLKGPYLEKSRDADIRIDIGERIASRRGKPVFIVSKDDVHTGMLIPDNAFDQDVKAEIRRTDLFMDRFMYDFSMNTLDGNRPVLYFDAPVTLQIHYTVNEGVVERLGVPENDLPRLASLFFFDRVKWLKVGGTFDLEKDFIRGDVRHFSMFALALDTGKEGLTVAPNPFTPNSDNDFDRVHFIADLQEGERAGARVRIYSLDGSLIRELGLGDGTLNNRTVDILWDGKDAKGRGLKEGLYIYQAVIGGRKFGGTVVLAR